MFHRNVATVIDGVSIAKDIKNELKAEISEWVAEGNRRPKLVAVIVGQDAASKTYIKNKMKAAQFTGSRVFVRTVFKYSHYIFRFFYVLHD